MGERLRDMDRKYFGDKGGKHASRHFISAEEEEQEQARQKAADAKVKQEADELAAPEEWAGQRQERLLSRQRRQAKDESARGHFLPPLGNAFDELRRGQKEQKHKAAARSRVAGETAAQDELEAKRRAIRRKRLGMDQQEGAPPAGGQSKYAERRALVVERLVRQQKSSESAAAQEAAKAMMEAALEIDVDALRQEEEANIKAAAEAAEKKLAEQTADHKTLQADPAARRRSVLHKGARGYY